MYARLLNKQAASDDQIMTASLIAGLQLYGLPHKDHTETWQYIQSHHIDVSGYKLHPGSGLMWSPEIHHRSVEEYTGFPTPVIQKRKTILQDITTATLEQVGEDSRDKDFRLKILKPIEALRVGSGSIARGTYSGKIIPLKAGTYPVAGVKTFSEVENCGKVVLPAVPGYKQEDRGKWPKGDKGNAEYYREKLQDIHDCAAYFQRYPSQYIIHLFTQQYGYVDIPLTLAEQTCKLARYEIQGEDTVTPWADAVVDTFAYVFFPSNGKGLDAADEYHLFDKRIRDVDGKVYITSAEDGVNVVTLPDEKTMEAVLRQLKREGLI